MKSNSLKQLIIIIHVFIGKMIKIIKTNVAIYLSAIVQGSLHIELASVLLNT